MGSTPSLYVSYECLAGTLSALRTYGGESGQALADALFERSRDHTPAPTPVSAAEREQIDQACVQQRLSEAAGALASLPSRR